MESPPQGWLWCLADRCPLFDDSQRRRVQMSRHGAARADLQINNGKSGHGYGRTIKRGNS
jgi:hypothetical protein